MPYKEILRTITNRMKLIEQPALEDDKYNDEWMELCFVWNSLHKLIKIEEAQRDETKN